MGTKRRLLVEIAFIVFGAILLSALLIWATVTDRVSVEAILVIIVLLIVAMFVTGQGMQYHARNLRLQEQAQESVTKTTMAVKIMMEFLREFTLKNQETISQTAEAQKAQVINELCRGAEDLLTSVGEAGVRHHLGSFKALVARKVMEIPTGIMLPLPRLEHFDQALQHLKEPEPTLKCPACGAAQTRISKIDSYNGILYTCMHCKHEFAMGLTVMLEKTS